MAVKRKRGPKAGRLVITSNRLTSYFLAPVLVVAGNKRAEKDVGLDNFQEENSKIPVQDHGLPPPGFGMWSSNSVKREGSYPTAKAMQETNPTIRKYWDESMSLNGSPVAR